MRASLTTTHTNTQTPTMEESCFFFFRFFFAFSSEISLPASFSLRHTRTRLTSCKSTFYSLLSLLCTKVWLNLGLPILWTSVSKEITLQVQRQQISVFCSEAVNLPAFHSICFSLQLLFVLYVIICLFFFCSLLTELVKHSIILI